MIRKRLIVGALAAFVVTTSPVWAGNNTLDEYVVTASRAKESVTEVAAAVTVIDAEAIENSTAADLGELLVEKGAVQVLQYPGALSSVGIRGFRTESHGNDLMGHVLILIDGRRAGTGNAAKLMTQNIERVEIIKGPAAVQYGSAAMGGVVNVITKRGTDEPSFFVGSKIGSDDFSEYGAGFSGRRGKVDFSASVSRTEEGDYKTGDGKVYDNTGNDGILRGSINVGYELSEGHRIGVIGSVFDADKVGNPSYITQNDKDNYKESENKSYDFTYDGQNSKGSLFWKARYFGGNDQDAWVTVTSGQADSKYEVETKNRGAQAQVAWNSDLFDFTTGVDWVSYDVASSGNPKDTEFSNTAGFLLAKGRFLDNLIVVNGGARFDHYEVEIHGGQGRDESTNDINPSFGMVCNVSKNVKLRANVAEAFRMPSAKELAYDYTTADVVYGGITYPGKHYVGNPDLDPEKSCTYEAGFDLAVAGVKSSFTVFKTDFKDKIVSAVNADGDSSWKNLGEATLQGVEAEVSYTFTDIFSGWEMKPYVGVTHLFTFEDKETGNDLQKTSDTTISSGIALTDLDGFSADLSLSYMSSQKVTDYQFSTYNEVTLDSVMVSNLTVSKRIYETDAMGSLTARGEVKNILDEDAAYVQGYPIPGRQFFAGLTWTY